MRILLIEDMVEFQELIGTWIASTFPQEIQVALASSAAQGEDLITNRGHHYDLIICDYLMPDGTGADIFRHLKRKNIPTPFILYTTMPHIDPADFEGENFLGMVPKEDFSGLQSLVEKSMATIPSLH